MHVSKKWIIGSWVVSLRGQHEREFGVHMWIAKSAWLVELYFNHKLYSFTRRRKTDA